MSKVKELVEQWEKELTVYEDIDCCPEEWADKECRETLLDQLKQAITEDVAEIERLLSEEINNVKLKSNENFDCGIYSGTKNGLEDAKTIVSKVLK